MNLTFIIKGSTATERHMIEHMFLICTKNYTEPRSLEEYVRSTLNEKDFDNFRSYHDYTECTFFNLKPEVAEMIKSELKTWYFTKEDFYFEKRILEIEYANLDYKLIKTEKQALGLTQEITDIKEIQVYDF